MTLRFLILDRKFDISLPQVYRVTVYVLLNSHVVCLLLISVFRYNCLYQFFEAHFEGHVTDFDKCQLTFTLSRCCKLKN